MNFIAEMQILKRKVSILENKNTKLQAENERLRQAISSCIGIIRASGSINTNLLADKLDQALKGD